MRIVIASNNKGKIREIEKLLSSKNIEVIPQTQLQVPEIPETGLTFVENSILKARNACKHTNLPAIADDSGIEVDALSKKPGIYSARYAGPKATYAGNIAKLLQELRDIPAPQRNARFQCVMVFLKSAEDPTPIICQGTWEGEITFAPEGANGFGYDSVFWAPTHKRTAAQLPPELKNKISHRAQALQKMTSMLIARSAFCDEAIQ
jgi:XTP/dITP diphosphohydrolase